MTNTANQLNSVHHSANSDNKVGQSGVVMANSNGVSVNNMVSKLNNKENYMPLHDFNEQRIAAMLGHANTLSPTSQFNKAALVLCSTLVTLWITTPNILKIDAHLAQIQ